MVEQNATRPGPEEGSATWPRIYRPGGGMAIFAFCSNLPFLAVGLFFIHLGITGRVPVPFGMILTGLLAIAIGVYPFAYTMCSRVILSPDAIEVLGPFGGRTLTLLEIAGRNMVPGRRMNGARGPALIPRDPKALALRLPRTIKTDAVYQTWLAAIPEVLADPADAGGRASRRSSVAPSD